MDLHAEIATLDRLIEPLVADLAPQLVARPGIGIECAAQLLVTFGDNPDRIRSEPAFAMLCGVAPLPASSGMTQRHRLNRGGDRQANSALHTIAISRLRDDPRTQTYVEQKTAEGHSKPEILRCLKRLLAREVYYLLRPAAPLRSHHPIPDLTAGRFLHHQPSRRRAGAVNLRPEASSDRPGLTAPSTGTASPWRNRPEALDTQGSIKGSQYTSLRFTQRLADAGVAPSTGSVGDSYDCEDVGYRQVA